MDTEVLDDLEQKLPAERRMTRHTESIRYKIYIIIVLQIYCFFYAYYRRLDLTDMSGRRFNNHSMPPKCNQIINSDL